jgi:hypothetical protein
MRRIRFAALLLLAACGGGGDDEPPPSPPLVWKRNCFFEYSLPGVPNSGITYRCYYITAECRTTSEVCEGIFPPTACPYTKTECIVCPTDKPLSQC